MSNPFKSFIWGAAPDFPDEDLFGMGQEDEYCWQGSLGIDRHIEDEEAEGQATIDPTEMREFLVPPWKRDAKRPLENPTSIHEQIKASQKQRAKRLNGNPSKETGAYWLYAEDTKRAHPEPTDRSGKWLVFCKPDEIDETWSKVKRAVAAGNLGKTAKCSTRKGFKGSDYVICVYTHDWKDEDSVQFVRQGLRDIGITRPIPYKTDADTLAGRYVATGAKGIAKFYE